MRWMSLVVACLTNVVMGSLFVFNIFQNDLKATFNFTKNEAEIQLIALGGGFELAFLTGLVFDNFGPKLTCVIGILCITPAYLLLWSTSKFPSYYSTKSWLVAVYLLFAGIGSVFIYMSCLNTNIKNYGEKHRGKVVGILDGIFVGSACIISVVYYQVFKTNSPKESFGSFMLCLCISSCFVGSLCILFLRLEKPLQKTDSSEDLHVLPSDDENDKVEQKNADLQERDKNIEQDESNNRVSKRRIPVKTLLKNTNYWLLLGVFGFASTVDLIYGYHITVITQSNGLSSYEQSLVVMIPVLDVIFTIISGLLYDAIKNEISREFLLIIACTCSTGCALTAMLWGDNYLVLCVSTFLCSAGGGMLWTYCPAIISEMLSLDDFGRNWGITLSLTSFIRWPTQIAFGILYDQVTQPNKIFCTLGMACVRPGLIILVITGVLSVVCGMILDFKRNLPFCCNFDKGY